MCTMTKGDCVAGWNLTGNAVSAEFDGSDEQERKELSVSQAVEIAAGALDAIPQLSVLGEVTGFRGPNARSGHCYFQIKDDSPPEEVQQTWYQTRKKIGDMRGTLPAGVLGPFFNDEFGDVYGSIFALSADGFSREELREFADRTRAELLQVKDVAKVEVFGAQPEKVFIELSGQRLAQLGLDLNTVIAQIGAQNAVENAGVLDAGSQNLQVRVGGQFGSLEALRQLPLRVVNPGTGVASMTRLGDVATIRRGYIDPPAVKVRHQGREVIALGVSMAKGGDIIALGEALQARVARIRQDLPAGIELSQVQDQPVAVAKSVGEFVKVLVEAVVVVLAVSFISLGLHTRPLRIDIWPGLVVALSFPGGRP